MTQNDKKPASALSVIVGVVALLLIVFALGAFVLNWANGVASPVAKQGNSTTEVIANDNKPLDTSSLLVNQSTLDGISSFFKENTTKTIDKSLVEKILALFSSDEKVKSNTGVLAVISSYLNANINKPFDQKILDPILTFLKGDKNSLLFKSLESFTQLSNLTTEESLVLVDDDGTVKFYFATGKSELAKDSEVALKNIIANVKEGNSIIVRGFHDSTGNKDINKKISKDRAIAVKNALQALGFAEDKIILEKPTETEGDGSNAEARRVEVIIQ